MTRRSKASLSMLLLACFSQITACSYVKYIDAPISVEGVNHNLQQKSASSTSFKDYLLKQGYPDSRWPIQEWDIDALMYSALFHHSALSVAKAKVAVAEASIASVSQRPIPNIVGKLGQSNLANDDISPWVYGLQIEIPMVTANKREIRKEEAEKMLSVARTDLADTAWRLRQQLVMDIIDYEENQRTIEWLQLSEETQRKLVAIVSKRLEQGYASSTELALLSIEWQKKQNILRAEHARTPAIIAKIAADAGLQTEQFKPTHLARVDLANRIQVQDTTIKSGKVQQEALLNRLDIRRALANYAAAEARLKLEVAKQHPDITLIPSYVFEMGDKIWTLGFSRLLNVINPQQKALIRQAEQLRSVEAAQFEAIQANIIANVSVALARYYAALQKLNQLDTTKNLEHVQFARLRKQFAAGHLDRLELTHAQLNNLNIAYQYLLVQFELLRLQANIETLLQKPLIAPPVVSTQGI